MKEVSSSFAVLFVSHAPVGHAATGESMGIDILHATPGVAALQAAVAHRPHAIVIDGRTNFDQMLQLFQSFRALDELQATPLVGLVAGSRSARSAEALEAGMDDCLNCTVGVREMVARLRSVSRRVARRVGPEVRFADVVLDLPGRKVHRRGRFVSLPQAQFALLHFLMLHPAQVFTRRDLLDRVWRNAELDEGAVTACIRRLRVALEDDGQLIQSARGGGYLLDDDLVGSAVA